MIFVLSKLGWALVRPGNLLAMVLVLGRLLQISRRPAVCRLGKSLVSGCVLLVAALTLLPVGQLTLRPLEERFPQPELPARIDGIILLGGSVHTEMTADRGSRYSTVLRENYGVRGTGPPLPGSPAGLHWRIGLRVRG